MTATTEDILAKAAEIVEAASAIPMAHFKTPLDLIAKSDESPVTIADRSTEEFIRARLRQAFPDDGIFGEEFGTTEGRNKALWIIDPIDGTRSFITGNPLFGMLLGLCVDGTPEAGIVRMPALAETFVGARGRGATLNGLPVEVRSTRDLGQAMIYVNEAEKIEADNPERFARLCRAGHTRRMAYDCYPHALVASGQIDVVVDFGLQPYDYLPLVALIESAGGIICDWQGRPLNLKSDGRVVTAATPALRDQILTILNA